jgi:hypothetical protein
MAADSAEVTIRTYDEGIASRPAGRFRSLGEKIAESAGAKTAVTVTKLYATTVNTRRRLPRMLPALERAAVGRVVLTRRATRTRMGDAPTLGHAHRTQ